MKSDDYVRTRMLPNLQRLPSPLHTLDCWTAEMIACPASLAERYWSTAKLVFQTAADEPRWKNIHWGLLLLMTNDVGVAGAMMSGCRQGSQLQILSLPHR